MEQLVHCRAPQGHGRWHNARYTLLLPEGGVLDWVDLTLEARQWLHRAPLAGFGGGMREARSLELIA
jgi:hypothetical protein